MSTSHELNLDLHARQGEAFLSEATEILYGGAAGGGKSHLMRVAAVIWCAAIPGLQVYLFRRIRDDLVKNHVEGAKGFRAMLAGWEACGFVKIVEDEIRFYNGPNGAVASKIYLCHCKDEKDIYKYQGSEIHVLLMDELTHFVEFMYRFLRNRVRMVGVKVPPEYKGKFPRILCGANPGNVGHQWVKSTFVDRGEYVIDRMPAPEGGMLRQYIPARLEDNPSMAEDDPEYEARLEGLGSEALVKAMRWGDWDVVEGAFFDTLSRHRHMVKPFTIPSGWHKFRSADWGSAKPFSVGWWAVATDTITTACGKTIPRGALVRYREWYGCVEGKPDTGLKLTAEDVGKGIKERDCGETLGLSVIDPAAFAQDGGPSLASRIMAEGIHFSPADNKRVAQRGALGGWDMMRHRINGNGDGHPMLFAFETCRDWWRTVPVLQHDDKRPEDLDTNAEDHAADETRYACMSRPWLPPLKEPTRHDRKDYGRAHTSEHASSNDGHFT